MANEGKCRETERGKDSGAKKWAGRWSLPKNTNFTYQNLKISMWRCCSDESKLLSEKVWNDHICFSSLRNKSINWAKAWQQNEIYPLAFYSCRLASPKEFIWYIKYYMIISRYIENNLKAITMDRIWKVTP